MLEIWDRRQFKDRHTTKTKHNPGKANNVKHSKTKLAWFSCLLWHSARKRGGHILQRSRAHRGLERFVITVQCLACACVVISGRPTATWSGCGLAASHCTS